MNILNYIKCANNDTPVFLKNRQVVLNKCKTYSCLLIMPSRKRGHPWNG